MKMPIQERRFFIHKHNVEQDMINREIEGNSGGNTRTYEGESINSFAKLEQNNVKRGQKKSSFFFLRNYYLNIYN